MLRSFRSIFGLIPSIFNAFATQQRFLSPFQLLVNIELFHQSSFYLKNIVSISATLFAFFSGGKVRVGNVRGKCPRPPRHLSRELLITFGNRSFAPSALNPPLVLLQINISAPLSPKPKILEPPLDIS